MRRREFLVGSAGALAGLAVGRYGPGALERLGHAGERAEVLRLDTWLGTLDGLGEIGALRIEQLGSAAPGIHEATRALAARLGVAPSEPVRAVTLEARTREAVAEDFRAGRVCAPDGWQLAETECLLATAVARHLESEVAEVVAARDGDVMAVEDWGARSTEVGRPFNLQSDGHAGLWFRGTGAPAWLQVVVDGDTVPATVRGDLVTSAVYGETLERILSREGRYPIELWDGMAGVRQLVGHLEVTARAPRARLPDGTTSAVFCPVGDWGPRSTPAGVAANPQTDGSIGLWIELACAPPRTLVRAGGVDLETRVAEGIVTARLSAPLFARERSLPVALYDPESGEELPVGTFEVTRPEGSPPRREA